MNSKGLKIFRIILLIASFAIVTLALFLFDNVDKMANEHIFMWIVIYLVCAAVFVPTLFPPKVAKNSSGTIVGLGILYAGAIPFALISVGLIFLALYKTLKVAIILEVIITFIFATRFFFVFLVGNHVENVSSKEKQLISKIKDLRTFSSMLETKTALLGETCADIKKLMSSVCEDLRYLSPVNNSMAFELEKSIYNELVNFDSMLSVATNNVNTVECTNELNKVKQLIAQRKSLIN